MINLKKVLPIITICTILISCYEKNHVYKISDFEKKLNSKNTSFVVSEIIKTIKQEVKNGENITLEFSDKRYDFHPEEATKREYYISNHDQVNPKIIGINIENIDNLTIEGGGAEFVFHGRMLPIVISNSENSTIQNLSIDFENPHITQSEIIDNDTLNGEITYKLADWVKYRVENKNLVVYGKGWSHTPSSGIAFEQNTRRLIYRTSDIWVGTTNIEEINPGVFKAKWVNPRLIKGSVIAMRGYGRPTPGIFLENNKNTLLNNVTVHYAEGMGLLAQLCENITLKGFNVSLRNQENPRYFTTQADATHFSACKGEIISTDGVYENMMDDAINVHGTYLKIIKRVSDNKVIARYMHEQAWGFDWGYESDQVQFIEADLMQLIGEKTKIKAIKAIDKPNGIGAREFEIEFTDNIDTRINESGVFGIENLEWTAKVLFANNIIRNNRARGTLFSTPKDVIVENNTFDHTSGTAILLCGDCNGWFETGACRSVVIRNNKFIGSLTNMFQFTNAIISIYPEIPKLNEQTKYFHGGENSGIIIENNYFETFDMPIVYAKSLDGLTFRNNKIVQNETYKPFHWNKHRFLFERVINYKIENNEWDGGFDINKDVKTEQP